MKIFVISVYKSLFEDVKKQPSKNVVKRCNKKEMMLIMLSRRIQLHFHFMYFIPIEFSNAKKSLKARGASMTVYRGSHSSILEPNPGILADSDLTATWQHCRLGYGYVGYLEQVKFVHCVLNSAKFEN